MEREVKQWGEELEEGKGKRWPLTFFFLVSESIREKEKNDSGEREKDIRVEKRTGIKEKAKYNTNRQKKIGINLSVLAQV